MMNKSRNQKRIALQTKQRSVNYFEKAVGNLAMTEISLPKRITRWVQKWQRCWRE